MGRWPFNSFSLVSLLLFVVVVWVRSYRATEVVARSGDYLWQVAVARGQGGSGGRRSRALNGAGSPHGLVARVTFVTCVVGKLRTRSGKPVLRVANQGRDSRTTSLSLGLGSMRAW